MDRDRQSVVYLALGPSRATAAQAYCDELASAGTPVHLIVAGTAEWRTYATSGVTVHRLVPGRGPQLRRRARTLLRKGLLKNAGLVVLGNLDAVALAPWVLRHNPQSVVRLEAVERLGHPEPAELAVVSPWYPSPNNQMAGAFVEAAIEAVRSAYNEIMILQPESWSRPRDFWTAALSKAVWPRLRAAGLGSVGVTTPLGELTRVPVPRLHGPGYAGLLAEHIDAVRATLPTGRIEAPLIHAHTGIYGGVLAARLGRPDARVVITEHSTFLAAIFSEPAARALFDEAVARADAVMCVGSVLRDQIAEQFPHHTGKLMVVPNAIDFDRFAARPQPVTDLLRWLYVGRFLPHKGVDKLLEAYAEIAREEPRATLTLVGSGSLETSLRDRVAELGLQDRVSIRPPVAPAEVAPLMHEHDLLVHASTVETFGMTVVEAVATGLPVLVARSAGPLETLAGLEGIAGTLVDFDGDPATLASAYRAMRASFSTLDLAKSRAVLESRYGREAVGRQLLSVYEGAPKADRLAVIALDPPSRPVVDEAITSARSAGLEVDLISAGPWRTAHPGVRLHPLASVRPPRQSSWVLSEAMGNVADRALTKIRRRRPAPPPLTTAAAWTAIRRSLDWTSVRRVMLFGVRSEALGRTLTAEHPHIVVTTSTEDLCSPRT